MLHLSCAVSSKIIRSLCLRRDPQVAGSFLWILRVDPHFFQRFSPLIWFPRMTSLQRGKALKKQDFPPSLEDIFPCSPPPPLITLEGSRRVKEKVGIDLPITEQDDYSRHSAFIPHSPASSLKAIRHYPAPSPALTEEQRKSGKNLDRSGNGRNYEEVGSREDKKQHPI